METRDRCIFIRKNQKHSINNPNFWHFEMLNTIHSHRHSYWNNGSDNIIINYVKRDKKTSESYTKKHSLKTTHFQKLIHRSFSMCSNWLTAFNNGRIVLRIVYSRWIRRSREISTNCKFKDHFEKKNQFFLIEWLIDELIKNKKTV